MGIQLPGDESGKSEKLRIEEIKSGTKIYEKNAEFFTETLKLSSEIFKTIQKYRDAEMAETEWKGKNDLEDKKIENALVDLEKIRIQSESSSNILELQKDHWAFIKQTLQLQLKEIENMPVNNDRHKIMDQTNTLLERLNNFKPGQ